MRGQTSDLLAYILKYIGMFWNFHGNIWSQREKKKRMQKVFVHEIGFFVVRLKIGFLRISKWFCPKNWANAENGYAICRKC